MILRGQKLQEAMLLAAEGNMTDEEIAARLGVSPRTFVATREQPWFDTRLAQVRVALKQTIQNEVENGLQGSCKSSFSPPRPLGYVVGGKMS